MGGGVSHSKPLQTDTPATMGWSVPWVPRYLTSRLEPAAAAGGVGGLTAGQRAGAPRREVFDRWIWGPAPVSLQRGLQRDLQRERARPGF